MRIYDDNGYLNIESIVEIGAPFTFICGGRGIGKTYGAIKYMDDHNIPFILMRRTQTQADLISKAELSPLKPVLSASGKTFAVKPVTKQCTAVYRMIGEDVIDSEPWCYTAALSTFSNVRGFDGERVKYVVYDEFIPERHERLIKDEGGAFLNFYETVNRNRELDGKPPLQVLSLANSFNICNPIFEELGLIDTADNMAANVSRETYVDRQRGLALIIPKRSPISQRKAKTSLYNLVGSDSNYSMMALDNSFAYEESGRIAAAPLIEYRPLVYVGQLAIYRHKSRQIYYGTFHKQGSPKAKYEAKSDDLKRFQRKYRWLWAAYMGDQFLFEKYSAQAYFRTLFS